MSGDAELPPPVRAYAERALPGNAPAPEAVRVTQTGEMWLKPGGRARRFEAEQDYAVGSVAFSWRARFPLAPLVSLHVVDRYAAGTGSLEATHGFTYSQMGIYIAKPGAPKAELMPGGGTDNVAYAALDPTTKAPVSNGARNVWVTETALTTALNTAYMAEQMSLFGIVVGVALLLSGVGFGILAVGGALRSPETALGFLTKWFPHTPSKTPTVRTA